MDFLYHTVLPTIFVAALYAAWRGIVWVYHLIIARQTVSVTIQSCDQPAWHWLQHWLLHHVSTPLQHWRIQNGGLGLIVNENPDVIGFRFENFHIRLRISRYQPVSNITLKEIDDEQQTAVLWTRGQDAAILQRLLRQMKKEYDDFHSNMVPLYLVERSGWRRSCNVSHRLFDTLTLRPGIVESVKNDLDRFLRPESPIFYKERGIPYRRGYLLQGPPGNGKSSFALALATYAKSEICMLSLTGKDIYDTVLKQLLVSTRIGTPPRLFILEDVDCLFSSRQQQDGDSRVTFSGLLNALDGIGSPENAILVMTTNHPERLDPALVRPGRADRVITFDNPSEECIRAHYLKFFPDASRLDVDAFTRKCPPDCSMATVQEMILREREEGIAV